MAWTMWFLLGVCLDDLALVAILQMPQWAEKPAGYNDLTYHSVSSLPNSWFALYVASYKLMVLSAAFSEALPFTVLVAHGPLDSSTETGYFNYMPPYLTENGKYQYGVTGFHQNWPGDSRRVFFTDGTLNYKDLGDEQMQAVRKYEGSSSPDRAVQPPRTPLLPRTPPLPPPPAQFSESH
ncbi:hypothetical protein FQN57_004927 [Myotisia sp. PD_48]|nr:hypothetical protein FQN57_004927 [Myotisia sp. PD_48]